MSYISDHLAEAFNRIISQYRFDVKIGRNPMELDPTAAFATMRLEGCKSTFIMRLHRNSDDVLIDVYEFRRDGDAYRTTADGAWVDMTGDTYFVDTWYNQNVPGSDLSQSDKANKPTLVPNQRSGWPVVSWDGTDDWLLSDKSANEFITPSEGVMMAGYKPEGTPPTVGIPNPYLCQAIVADYDAFAPLTRGICTPYGPNDSVFADMYSTTEYAVPMEVLAGNWYNVVWKLYNNILYGYKNGALAGTENAGVISSDLSSVLVMGHYPWHGVYLEGDTDQVYTFNENVSEQDIYDIHLFMKNGGDTDINKIKKVIKCLVEQVQDIEDALQPFFERLNIASQSGAQLDGIGDIVGQAREFFTDDIYKQILYLKIVRNISEGTPEELIEIFSTMTGAEIVQYIEQYPAAFTLTAINPDYLFDFLYIYEAILKAKPAGVGLGALVESYEPAFSFLDYSGPDTTSGFSDVVPPGEPTTGGVFASLIPTYSIPKVDPLSLSPTGLYATRRLPNCASAHIMRVYRVTAADEVDVYDVQQGTSNYKLTGLGSWIDGSSETFRLVTWYDQSGNGRNFAQSTSANQPSMTFNVFNGWPVVRGDGADDTLASTATAADFIDADAGTILVTMATNGSFSSQADVYDLPPLIADDNANLGLYVGEDTTTNETLVWNYNDDGTDDQVGAEFYDGEFYNCVWRHSSGNLLSDIAYYLVTLLGSWGTVASGNTASLTGTMKMFGGLTGGGATPFKGDLAEVIVYNYQLTNLQIEGVKRYLKSN